MSKKNRIPKYLRNLFAQREPPSPVNLEVSTPCEISILREVKHITRRASQGTPCVVGLGEFVLFSSRTGDAWLLDPKDELALCLMRQGAPLPFKVGETDKTIAIEWTGHYSIQGGSFTYGAADDPTRTTAFQGYPTDVIAETSRRLLAGS